MSIALRELFTFSPDAPGTHRWQVLNYRRDAQGRINVRIRTADERRGVRSRHHRKAWAEPIPDVCADAPDKYHPLYAPACLEGSAFDGDIAPGEPTDYTLWRVPELSFTTNESTRLSMTLNGMRMSTEFYKTGSERVLELLRNRLELEQRDVVADVLVYQFRRVVDVRVEMDDARVLRAESLAAYLGLVPQHVLQTMWDARFDADLLLKMLQGGTAGDITRNLNLEALVANQLQLLTPELAKLKAREDTARHLLRESAQLLAAVR